MSQAEQFFDDLVRCETRLYNGLSTLLRSTHGIATSQFEFLRFVRDHPRCRVGDVAAWFVTGVGAMSKGVDRLEQQEWLRRVPNPTDRRSSLLELTESGAELVAAAESTFNDGLRALIEIDPAQLAAAVTVLSAVRAKLERNGIGTPVG